MALFNFSIGGSSLNNLIELKTININPTDTTVPLLGDCTEVGICWLSRNTNMVFMEDNIF